MGEEGVVKRGGIEISSLLPKSESMWSLFFFFFLGVWGCEQQLQVSSQDPFPVGPPPPPLSLAGAGPGTEVSLLCTRRSGLSF